MSIVVDAETLAIDTAAELCEPVSAPSNYTTPKAIEDYIAKAAAKQVEKAALYPYTARIIALGWCEEGDEVERVHIINNEAREAAVLEEFWALSWPIDTRSARDAVRPLVTFNGRRFDLPLLMVRSMFLGVKAPKLDIRKYYSPHPDLLERLTWNGELDYRSLRWFAKRFGLDTSDAFSGKEVAQLYDAGDWESIRIRCTSDVRLTRQLAERIGVLKPRRSNG